MLFLHCGLVALWSDMAVIGVGPASSSGLRPFNFTLKQDPLRSDAIKVICRGVQVSGDRVRDDINSDGRYDDFKQAGDRWRDMSVIRCVYSPLSSSTPLLQLDLVIAAFCKHHAANQALYAYDLWFAWVSLR